MKTGRLAWRLNTIPAPGEKGHETWPGESWKYGGGSTWMTGSFDPDLNLVYWGVGDAASDLYAGNRRGDNLYTGSVVALDADTGKLKWYYQEVPQDVWDYDSSYKCILVDLPVKGRMRVTSSTRGEFPSPQTCSPPCPRTSAPFAPAHQRA